MKTVFMLLLQLSCSIPGSLGGQPDTLSNHSHRFFNGCSFIKKTDYRMPSGYESRFVLLEDGQTYTGSISGIMMWDRYSNIRISTENSRIPENHVTALALDQDDQLWIGTKASGIVIGTGIDVKPFRVYPVQTHDLQILSIYTDAVGLVWVCFENGGLECFLNGISCKYFQKE